MDLKIKFDRITVGVKVSIEVLAAPDFVTCNIFSSDPKELWRLGFGQKKFILSVSDTNIGEFIFLSYEHARHFVENFKKVLKEQLKKIQEDSKDTYFISSEVVTITAMN